MYIAEKAFVILIVVGNGYAFLSRRSAICAQRKNPSDNSPWSLKVAAALLSLIFLFGAIWQLGFVNYLLGMVGVIAGLTQTSGESANHRFAIISWGLLTYFCHPIAFLFFMGTFSLRELLKRNMVSQYLVPQRANWAPFLKSFTLWFGLPLLLLAAYVATHSEVSTFRGASPWRLLGLAYYHNDLALFTSAEIPFAKAVVFISIVVSLLGVLSLRKDDHSRTFAGVGAGVLLGAIVFSPDYFAGGALIHQRLIPFLFIWVLWCTAHAFLEGPINSRRLLSRLGFGLIVFATVCSVGLSYHRTKALTAIVDLLNEFRDFTNEIPVGTAILPVSASATGVIKGQELSLKPVLHHYAGVIDCKRSIVLLDNYEAYVGYFPLLWKDGKNPFDELSRGLEEHPATLRVGGAAWIGQNVDYIVSMGRPEEAFESSTKQWLFSKLHLNDQKKNTSIISKQGNFHLIKVNKEAF